MEDNGDVIKVFPNDASELQRILVQLDAVRLKSLQNANEPMSWMYILPIKLVGIQKMQCTRVDRAQESHPCREHRRRKASTPSQDPIAKDSGDSVTLHKY